MAYEAVAFQAAHLYLLQAAYCYYASPYPKFLSRLLFFYMITLLALFMNFYIKKHSRTSPKPSSTKAE